MGGSSIGTNDNGDFTFAPMEQTCNLGVLAPSKQIPSIGGTAAATAQRQQRRLTEDASRCPTRRWATRLFRSPPDFPRAPESARGASLCSAARQLREPRSQKAASSVPAGTSPYKYAASLCAPTERPTVRNSGRHQSQRRLGSASRRERQRNLSGRAAGNLLPDDLRGGQQAISGLGTGSATQGWRKFLTLDQSNAVPLN